MRLAHCADERPNWAILERKECHTSLDIWLVSANSRSMISADNLKHPAWIYAAVVLGNTSRHSHCFCAIPEAFCAHAPVGLQTEVAWHLGRPHAPICLAHPLGCRTARTARGAAQPEEGATPTSGHIEAEEPGSYTPRGGGAAD